MKIAVVDSRIPKDAKSALSCYADKIIEIPPFSRLQAPVSAHPDMLLFPTKNEIITNKRYAEENSALFRELSELSGRKLVFDEADLAPDYPSDVRFNCFCAGGRIFGLAAALSEKVVDWANSQDTPVVSVRQGYAKCSACVVSCSAVITEDVSIEKTMKENGVDVLRVTPGHVVLDGYDRGFIGGASGTDSENVYFCGDVTSHPEFEKINDFCRKHGKSCVSLGCDRLYDIGTIFFLV